MFINETRAKGVLYLFWTKGKISKNNYQPLLYPVMKEKAESGFHFFNSSYNYSTISAYDIEFNNKIHSGLPASEIKFEIDIMESERAAEIIGNSFELYKLRF